MIDHDKMKDIGNLWSVRIAYPSFYGPEHDKITFMKNGSVGVLAETVQEAIAATLEQFPGASVWGVSHQGKIQINAAHHATPLLTG